MNFVDTAITLLHESGKPMAAEELCRLATERDMLDKPGANPLRSMKTRLTVELKKGRSSRLAKDDDDVWSLRKGAKLPAGLTAASKAKPAAAAKAKPKAKAASKTKAAAKAKPAAKATAKAKAAAKAKPTAKATAKAAPKTKAAAKAKPAGKAAAKTKAAAKAKPAVKAKAAAKAKPAAKSKSKKATAEVQAKPEAKALKAKKAKAKPAAKSQPKADAKSESKTGNAKLESKPKSKARRSKAAAADSSQAVSESSSDEAQEQVVMEPVVDLTPEEKALVELYSVESAGTMSAGELNEYRDAQTSDEDRLMLPEIRAERRPRHRRERAERRPKRRREGRERETREARPRQSSQSRTQPTGTLARTATDLAGAPIEVLSAESVAREGLTRSALKVLATLPPGQTMPVRQLTQTMIRKNLIEGSADQLWRMVKGTLLVSEQRRMARGLTPLVRYHGRDLFAAGPQIGRSVVDVATATLARAAEDYAAAVETEMLQRLSSLAIRMLERFGFVYLQATGWTEIQWVKRVENTSYALALGPSAVEQSMIALRAGPDQVDRRGIGELRAGLHAKDIPSGFLLSPCEMSEAAEVELAKDGAPVRVLCGKDFAAEITAHEIGVTRHHLHLPRIDQRFLDAILG